MSKRNNDWRDQDGHDNDAHDDHPTGRVPGVKIRNNPISQGDIQQLQMALHQAGHLGGGGGGGHTTTESLEELKLRVQTLRSQNVLLMSQLSRAATCMNSVFHENELLRSEISSLDTFPATAASAPGVWEASSAPSQR